MALSLHLCSKHTQHLCLVRPYFSWRNSGLRQAYHSEVLHSPDTVPQNWRPGPCPWCLQSPSPASISLPTSFPHSSLIWALPGDVLGSLPRHLVKGQLLTFSKHHLLVFILALLQVFPNYFVEEHGKHDLGQPTEGTVRPKVKTSQVTSALCAAPMLHPALL